MEEVVSSNLTRSTKTKPQQNIGCQSKARDSFGSGAWEHAFRAVDRHGRVASGRLNAGSIARIVKRAAGDAGLDPAGYVGHSLRAGFATQAFLNGVTEVFIMRQTRHKSLNTLRK